MSINFSSKISKVLYKNRFCKQENFDVIVSGSTRLLKHSWERKNLRMSAYDFDKIETIYHSKRHSYCDRTFCERSNVWTVCSRVPIQGKSDLRPSFKFVDSYRIYLDKTDQWINVVQTPDDRSDFNACSFMKNIYVFGGFSKTICLNSSYTYDTKKSKWMLLASMNEYRQFAACTVFKGKIVLTGGYDGDNEVNLRSVEAYDYYENK